MNGGTQHGALTRGRGLTEVTYTAGMASSTDQLINLLSLVTRTEGRGREVVFMYGSPMFFMTKICPYKGIPRYELDIDDMT